ncbi:hypothetical protein Mmah_0913 [Methanohalophilus mahii DSM 5219]|uniref:Uncharacterized protein n=1 Tax=Methanohalophilus mahii (strain ATCC 35705 / DSM 5219 / SLP) TaxID=547558 RepID=D5EB83_METMS|nr:hypothetical protein Mmah_0913 [Methanohalophilus mahii DSM 5219]
MIVTIIVVTAIIVSSLSIIDIENKILKTLTFKNN